MVGMVSVWQFEVAKEICMDVFLSEGELGVIEASSFLDS